MKLARFFLNKYIVKHLTKMMGKCPIPADFPGCCTPWPYVELLWPSFKEWPLTSPTAAHLPRQVAPLGSGLAEPRVHSHPSTNRWQHTLCPSRRGSEQQILKEAFPKTNKQKTKGTSLAVQWLRLRASTAGGNGFDP